MSRAPDDPPVPPAKGDLHAMVTTLSHVARRAGVGQSTVSRVLRNHGSVSQATREKILKAAADLHYVPNRIAGTLASMTSKLVGIVIPSVGNTVVPEVLAGVNAVLEDAGFQPVIGVSNYDPQREEMLIESILSWRPSGLLVAGLEHTERARGMLKGCGVRVVEMLDIDGAGVDMVVGTSHHAAGRASAQYLLGRGYRRIGYVGHDIRSDLRAGKRLEGFRQVMAEQGLVIQDHEFSPHRGSSVEGGKIGVAALLDRRKDLDAIYFSNDDLAIGGYFHCVENGISIPGELALFGYNGLDIARLTPQPLSTIRSPRIAMGKSAAELLLAGGPAQVVDMAFDLIPGATS
ncbi:MAG: periplasmic binding protein/LacI transcriptional regulator [Alphaproteobacteria bacterium]|nr:periplasmic binding protein/LacI transcriptional regulator [Alphaproteobacteria bacterium]